MRLRQYGFTLVELMIAIVLGLIIVAAAIQLFYSGRISLNMQRGMSEVQDNANFGLQYLAKDLRLTNLGASSMDLKSTTPYGGVVFTSPKSVNSSPTAIVASNFPSTIPATLEIPLSKSSIGTTGNTGTTLSDQLVIQYKAIERGVDCEGQLVRENEYVIQRYYVTTDTNGSTEELPALALYCEAGRYVENGTTITQGSSGTGTFGTSRGEMIIRRIDLFKVRYGVSLTDQFRYVTPEQYLLIAEANRPKIESVQIAMIVRSADSVGNNSVVPLTPSFNVFGDNVTIAVPQDARQKYMRQLVLQTIAIRNGLAL